NEKEPKTILTYEKSFQVSLSQSYDVVCNCMQHSEPVFGMLVWILIGGTDYFPLSALCWVMFVAILITRLPWNTLSLCFHCSATVLYLVTAAVDALSVNQATRGRHNYNCWAASAFFAFLTTLCYAGSSYLSYRGWKISREEQ
uniref:CKLF-like MARVEL transmembrane domain containing 8b n=1 Tax=Amphiprion percula TaxID=161767 RepID=A0A3P8TGI6_AMPPE